jgi:hypothetical protein
MEFTIKFAIMGDESDNMCNDVIDRINKRLVNPYTMRFCAITLGDAIQEYGISRIPVLFRFQKNDIEEDTIIEIYSWTRLVQMAYAFKFGIDEITVNGFPVEVPEQYRIEQTPMQIV